MLGTGLLQMARLDLGNNVERTDDLADMCEGSWLAPPQTLLTEVGADGAVNRRTRGQRLRRVRNNEKGTHRN